MLNVHFQICSLFYSFLLICIYFSKERVKTIENRIYIVLAITNFIGLLLDIFSVFTIVNRNTFPILNVIITKSYLLYLLTWMYLFTIYIFTISVSNDSNKEKKIFKFVKVTIPIYCIFFILVIIKKLLYVSKGSIIYSYGPAASSLYVVSGIFIVSWLLLMLLNYKNLKSKKYLPMFAYLVIGTIVTYLQMKNPSLLLLSSMETFVIFLMFFTIENPDLKMIQKLNIARDQAEKANHAKTDFLSSMSHEIRTPLNAIVGFSQALSEEDIPDSAKDEVNDIIMASNNLLELVNGILDISKIEANKLEIVNTEYSFKKIWDELILLTKARLGEKPLELRFFYDNSIPDVLYGDHARLKQIILNLLTNAVKYTKNGFIEMKVHSFKQNDICRLILYVEDSGIGIKQENISKLFNKFERLDLEKNNTIEGTGLGLAITKKLVELMNGQIVVQSTYGKGSKFIISIDQKIVANPVKKVEEKSKIDISNIDFSDKKVLIVDDNKVNLKVAERLLQKFKVQTTCVESGFECLEKVNNEKYDLILIDDMMPRMSGSETLIKLKEKEDFNTPVVALTANAISGMKEKYLEKGFDDYLAKPIERHELKRIVNKYLNK